MKIIFNLKKMLIMITIFKLFTIIINASIFENIEWKREKTKKDITLYIQHEEHDINYYKAESIQDGIDIATLLNNVLSFEKYCDIFNNTKFFKIVKELGPDKYLLSVELNFFPYRNRTYFIECVFIINENQNEYIVEWYPAKKEIYKNMPYNKNARLISYIHGRWTIRVLKDKKIYISINYHNDWETNLPNSFVHKIEKYITIKNLNSLIQYCKK